MNKNKEKQMRRRTRKALKALPEAHAKYILEHDLQYPTLEQGGKPDLRNEYASIGVEVTVCDVDKWSGLLSDIANGKAFPDQAKTAEKELYEHLFTLKKSHLDKALPPHAISMPILTEVALKEIMKVKASCLVMTRSENVDLIEANIEKALENKLKKISKYESFKRMELFIFMPLFAIDDTYGTSPDVFHTIPQLYEMINERVFSQSPSFDMIHIDLYSTSLKSQALFTFSRDGVQKTKISPWETMGRDVFMKYSVPDPRDPQRVSDVLNRLDQHVDKELVRYLNEAYPLDDCRWEQELGMDVEECTPE